LQKQNISFKIYKCYIFNSLGLFLFILYTIVPLHLVVCSIMTPSLQQNL